MPLPLPTMQRCRAISPFREHRELHLVNEFLSGALNTTNSIFSANVLGVNVAYGLGALAVIGGGIYLLRKAYQKVFS